MPSSQTAGLITLEITDHIAKTGRCNYIPVSIDGSCPETHDRIQGKGSFEAAVRGIKILQKAGVHVTSRVTIHRYNLDDLENTARFLLDEIGMYAISTNSACHQGLARSNEEEVGQTPAEQSIAWNEPLSWQNSLKPDIGSSRAPIPGKRISGDEKARVEGRTIQAGDT